MRAFVLGNLPYSSAQEGRLHGLGFDVVPCETVSAFEDHGAGLRASDVVFFNNIDVNPVLPLLSNAHLVVVASTGYDFVDTRRASELGVALAHLTSYSTRAVAEYVLWGALDCVRPLGRTTVPSDGLGAQGKEPWFGRELISLRAGVIGYGRVGRRVGELLRGVGMQLVATSRSPTAVSAGEWVPLEELLSSCHLVVLCVSLNPTSRFLLNEQMLHRLRDDALLVSVSPNKTIDMRALISVLQSRPRMQAVLDLDIGGRQVRELEKLSNVRVTPHVAFATLETLDRRFEHCIDQVEARINGADLDWVCSPIRSSGPEVSAQRGSR
jgi:lactate dehydrogenase-like 2-hydroxyacid dehydrogenase